MASKKDSNSVNKGKENSQDDLSLLELSNLDKKTEIVSQTSEVSKNDDDNGFAKFGFNQSILNALNNKGYKNPTPIKKLQFPN